MSPRALGQQAARCAVARRRRRSLSAAVPGADRTLAPNQVKMSRHRPLFRRRSPLRISAALVSFSLMSGSSPVARLRDQLFRTRWAKAHDGSRRELDAAPAEDYPAFEFVWFGSSGSAARQPTTHPEPPPRSGSARLFTSGWWRRFGGGGGCPRIGKSREQRGARRTTGRTPQGRTSSRRRSCSARSCVHERTALTSE